jgi:hypothetical protein
MTIKIFPHDRVGNLMGTFATPFRRAVEAMQGHIQLSSDIRRGISIAIILGVALIAIVVLLLTFADSFSVSEAHCSAGFLKSKWPLYVGCILAAHEGLAGGLIGAAGAVFAGWLAWSAVQVQIAAEERRAAADRVEVEQVLQGDLDAFAEVLGAIWKILEGWEENEKKPEINRRKLSGVTFGIEHITKDTWLSSSRKMVEALGWKRRRDYEALFAGLERLGQIREANFDAYEALAAVRSVSVDFEYLRPDSEQYFKGRFRRAGKAYSFGYAVEVQAGVAQEGRASFEPGD